MRHLRFLALAAIAASATLSVSAAAQSTADQLTFYGFINQAYGVSGQTPIQGLNKDATTDYRAAALQLRFAISPNDNFVVQALTRSRGTNPLSSDPGVVLVDWAFYHHRFDNASIRVGRIPAPFGFLAETREVGTLLPFYRAPAGYYLEAIRNLDGLTLTNQHAIAGGQLETTVYGGGTSGTLLTWVPPGLPFSYVLTKARFERLVGLQTVYTTPIEGVRLLGGLSTLRFLDTAKVQTAGPAVRLDLLNAGIDARFDRVFARGETRRAKNGSNAKTYNYYVQTGIRPLQNLWINAQGDFGTVDNYVPATDSYADRMMSADRALSLSYSFAPNIVGKMEQHWASGGIDGYVAPNAILPLAHYSIASLAVSF
jgi:hypothetical protein